MFEGMKPPTRRQCWAHGVPAVSQCACLNAMTSARLFPLPPSPQGQILHVRGCVNHHPAYCHTYYRYLNGKLKKNFPSPNLSTQRWMDKKKQEHFSREEGGRGMRFEGFLARFLISIISVSGQWFLAECLRRSQAGASRQQTSLRIRPHPCMLEMLGMPGMKWGP